MEDRCCREGEESLKRRMVHNRRLMPTRSLMQPTPLMLDSGAAYPEELMHQCDARIDEWRNGIKNIF